MERPNTINPARGYPIALLSAAILSLTAIFIRYLTVNHHMPAMILAFWRDLLAFTVLFSVLLVVRPVILRSSRENVPFLIVYGLELSVLNAAWTYSVALNGAAVATVLIYSSTAFTVLLGWWFLGERLNGVRIAAVVLGLAGCVLVSDALEAAVRQANMSGIMTGVFSGFCYGIYTLLGRAASQRGLNPWTTVLHTFGYATTMLLVYNLLPAGWIPGTASRITDFLWLGTSTDGWLILFLLAAGPTVLGYGLYTVSLVHLPSGVANLIATLEPVFTAVIAWLWFHEQLNPAQILGSILILSGVVVLRLFDRMT